MSKGDFLIDSAFDVGPFLCQIREHVDKLHNGDKSIRKFTSSSMQAFCKQNSRSFAPSGLISTSSAPAITDEMSLLLVQATGTLNAKMQQGLSDDFEIQ